MKVIVPRSSAQKHGPSRSVYHCALAPVFAGAMAERACRDHGQPRPSPEALGHVLHARSASAFASARRFYQACMYTNVIILPGSNCGRTRAAWQAFTQSAQTGNRAGPSPDRAASSCGCGQRLFQPMPHQAGIRCRGQIGINRWPEPSRPVGYLAIIRWIWARPPHSFQSWQCHPACRELDLQQSVKACLASLCAPSRQVRAR